MKLPKSIANKLEQRKQNNALRVLPTITNLIDFTSNDYLGYSKSEALFDKVHQFLVENNIKINGATGSRLISGNHSLYQKAETFIAEFHESESALIFNSGYDANVGFFSSVPQRNDVILYDELCHASIRDGIQLSNAKSYKFDHNDVEDLERLIQKHSSLITHHSSLFIAIESVYSRYSNFPNLKNLVSFC